MSSKSIAAKLRIIIATILSGASSWYFLYSYWYEIHLEPIILCVGVVSILINVGIWFGVAGKVIEKIDKNRERVDRKHNMTEYMSMDAATSIGLGCILAPFGFGWFVFSTIGRFFATLLAPFCVAGLGLGLLIWNTEMAWFSIMIVLGVLLWGQQALAGMSLEIANSQHLTINDPARDRVLCISLSALISTIIVGLSICVLWWASVRSEPFESNEDFAGWAFLHSLLSILYLIAFDTLRYGIASTQNSPATICVEFMQLALHRFFLAIGGVAPAFIIGFIVSIQFGTTAHEHHAAASLIPFHCVLATVTTAAMALLSEPVINALSSTSLTKRCGRCGKGVASDMRVGDRCPHCNTKWNVSETIDRTTH